MSWPVERFPFVQRDPQLGPAGMAPFVPLALSNGQHSLSSQALVDTGATVNVLPHQVGVQLGLDWDQHTLVIPLSGNLAAGESRAVRLDCRIGHLPPVVLVFAWTSTDVSPLILGQINFFLEYDVCFFRSQEAFEISPKRWHPSAP